MKSIFSGKSAILIALVIAAAGVGFGVSQYNEAQKLKTPAGAQKVKDDEDNSLKAKVAILMQLPNEKPTVATVDITKVKGQAFFKDAKNGDKVLIFAAARKAVIYRESTNKIINAGPIAVTSDQQAAQNVSVLASLNGSSSDATGKLANVKEITVTEAKATKNYSKTEVVDVSGSNGAKAQEIATALGGEVAPSVPTGETAPDGAAIVVFVKQ